MKPELLFRLALGAACAVLTPAAAQTLEVTSTGVGIGTASPGTKLHVFSATTGNDALLKSETSQTSGVNVGLWMTGGAANANWLIGTNRADIAGAADNLLFYKVTGAAGTKMVIGNDGNVGIGTTSPAGKLEVARDSSYGDFTTTGFLLTSATTPNKQLRMGYDLSIDAVYLQAAHTGIATKSLLLNPSGGNVGIGTASPGYKLEVAGSVRATSFIANSNTYADFVFKPGYQLRSLSEVEAAIKANGHLPDIPSEAEAKARGIDLAAMQVKLLQKVEELTLYLVAHDKELERLRARNETLERQLAEFEKR